MASCKFYCFKIDKQKAATLSIVSQTRVDGTPDTDQLIIMYKNEIFLVIHPQMVQKGKDGVASI